MVVACNFTPVPRAGLPRRPAGPGRWREMHQHRRDGLWRQSGVGNWVASRPEPNPGTAALLGVRDVPPLAALFFVAEA